MKPETIKLLLAALLGIAWAVVVYHPPGDPAQAADIIGWIKVSFGTLGVYHMGSKPKHPGDA